MFQLRALGTRFPCADEFGRLFPHRDRPFLHGAAAAKLLVIELEPAAERHDVCRFLFQLSDFLRAVCAGAIPVSDLEAPSHQIPRDSLAGEETPLKTCGIDGIHRGKVAGEEVDRRRRFRHGFRGIHPVACDLEIRRFRLDRLDIMGEIVKKAFPQEGKVIGIAVFAGLRRRFVRNLPPCRKRHRRVVQLQCPAFAVDPCAVQVPVERQLRQLRDEQAVCIPAENGHFLFTDGAVRLDGRPFRVQLRRTAVKDAGVVRIQRDIAFCRQFTPHFHLVAQHDGRRVADLCRIGGIAGMPLGVDLHIVRPDFVEQPGDDVRPHLFCDTAFRPGVEIKMEAKKGISAFLHAGSPFHLLKIAGSSPADVL